MLSVYRNLLSLITLSCVVFMTGCSMMAPKYSASMENVQILKNAEIYSAKVGKFSSLNAEKEISIRGSSLASPYGGSYAMYLSEAVTQELTLAGKLKPESTVEISGVLIKNDLNTGLGSTAQGDIEAKFMVSKEGQIRYNKVKVIHHEWSSSFVGAIAIPRAQEEYAKLVQLLLAELYADQSFLDALK